MLRAAGRQIAKRHKKAQRPHGRQSVKKLMAHGENVNSIEVETPKLFDRMARRFNVDYAFYKTGPDKYLLFFKAGQADAITACFERYSRRLLEQSKSSRIPIREQLEKAAEQLVKEPPKTQERTKEVVREERYYACSTYKNRSRTACTMHSIKHNRLEAAVLFAVQQQIHLAVSYSEMIARINTAPVKKSQSIRLEELIAAKERELAKISRYKQSLYQDWKDGEITQQDYRDMKADYERQTIALTDVLARLNAERAELANGVKSEHPALVAFTKHQNIDQLSRELLVELIDHIKVYENGNISVRFKFADEFRRIAEYIEINTTKPAVAG